jgi:hypothetical protein
LAMERMENAFCCVIFICHAGLPATTVGASMLTRFGCRGIGGREVKSYH